MLDSYTLEPITDRSVEEVLQEADTLEVFLLKLDWVVQRWKPNGHIKYATHFLVQGHNGSAYVTARELLDYLNSVFEDKEATCTTSSCHK